MLTGIRDPYGQNAPALEAWLRSAGVDLDAHRIGAGHDLTADDAAAAKAWLQRCADQRDR
jgi:predicted esterase